MSRLFGPWVGMTVDQGSTFILRAMLAFKARDGRWPIQRDPPDPLLHGFSWATAGLWLFKRGSSLLKLRSGNDAGYPWPASLEALTELAVEHAKLEETRTGVWPSVSADPIESLTGQPSWLSLNAACKYYHNTTLIKLWGRSVRRAKATPRESLVDVCAFYQNKGRWPSQVSNDPEEKSLGQRLNQTRTRHPDVCVELGVPLAKPKTATGSRVAQEALAEAVAAYIAEHGASPGPHTIILGQQLGQRLYCLRRRNPEMCHQYKIPLNPKTIPIVERAKRAASFIQTHEREPRKGERAPLDERRLARDLSNLRRCHPDICTRHGISLERVDPPEYLSTQILPVVRCWRVTARSLNVEGSTGAAIQTRLKEAFKRPLGASGDICQVNTLGRLWAEVEHDCWRFTLKGAKRPDPRPWTDILASGDNKLIETAERIAFLDWDKSEEGAVETSGGRGARRYATRRPWFPPATQPEAGKPAPAKGKGKRASTKA